MSVKITVQITLDQARYIKLWAAQEMIDILRNFRHARSHGELNYSDPAMPIVQGVLDQLDPLNDLYAGINEDGELDLTGTFTLGELREMLKVNETTEE